MHFKYNPFSVVISSPSGAGKSTLCKMLTTREPDIKLSVSTTTRPKRTLETEGKDYFFVSEEKFWQLVKENQFVEYAKICDNWYGTSISNINNNQNILLFDIDWQGTEQLLKQNATLNKNNILTIFILPPSPEELHKRLKNRAQDSDEVIKKRMMMAQDEIAICCGIKPGNHQNMYDYILINENLDDTYNKIKTAIDAFKIKQQNRNQIQDFAKKLVQTKWNF